MINVIPAIDIIKGKSVRLTKGEFDSVEFYPQSPLDLAKTYADIGVINLHLVDLDGARERRIVNYKTLEKIANQTTLKVDFSGGISCAENLRIAFECGATQVCIGSLAVKDPDLVTKWLDNYGADKIIISADSRKGMISINGWQSDMNLSINDLLSKYYHNKVIKYCLATDIDCDGTLLGPNLDLYRKLQEDFNKLNFIASGGVARIEDLVKLNEIGIWGVVVGKALLNNKITLKELAKFNLGKGF
jgi:phosphoribosylformimino-5-aminoimidazole carboxamide ribotide isomerase